MSADKRCHKSCLACGGSGINYVNFVKESPDCACMEKPNCIVCSAVREERKACADLYDRLLNAEARQEKVRFLRWAVDIQRKMEGTRGLLRAFSVLEERIYMALVSVIADLRKEVKDLEEKDNAREGKRSGV